jgi:hypothetical protein
MTCEYGLLYICSSKVFDTIYGMLVSKESEYSWGFQLVELNKVEVRWRWLNFNPKGITMC